MRISSASDLETLVNAYSAEVFGYLWRMLRETADAEDCLQETFLRAYRAYLHRVMLDVICEAKSGAVYYDVLPRTLIGPVFVAVNERGLVAVAFGEAEEAFVAAVGKRISAPVIHSAEKATDATRQVGEYLTGKRNAFDLPVDLSRVTDFQRRVLLATRQVPRGQMSTYGEIARRIGQPRAARAVGQAFGRNPVPIVIPCHRVLASDGSLGGYSGGGGVKTKAQLLRLQTI